MEVCYNRVMYASYESWRMNRVAEGCILGAGHLVLEGGVARSEVGRELVHNPFPPRYPPPPLPPPLEEVGVPQAP